MEARVRFPLRLYFHRYILNRRLLWPQVKTGPSRDKITRYGQDGPGIELQCERFFASVQTGPRVQPAFHVKDTVSFPGVKRPGRGVDHPHLAPSFRERVQL